MSLPEATGAAQLWRKNTGPDGSLLRSIVTISVFCLSPKYTCIPCFVITTGLKPRTFFLHRNVYDIISDAICVEVDFTLEVQQNHVQR